jgi:long-chain acyl-CoA synthetase
MTTCNLAELLERSAAEHPGREAIVFGRQRITYSELDELANQCARVLAEAGIAAGDKVALSCPNVPYFAVAYFGILKAGGVVVPLNVLNKAREIAYYLEDSDAKAFLCFEGSDLLPTGAYGLEAFHKVDGCEHMLTITADPTADSSINGAEALGLRMSAQPSEFTTVETDEDDTAVIFYTSGTTGLPKGAELRHRNIRDNALTMAELFHADPEHPDTVLCVLPLFHTFGQVVCQNTTLAVGGTIVLQPQFEPRAALRTMLDESVTFFAGVPTMYWQLLGALDAEYDVARLAKNMRLAVSGGAALPVEVHQEFEEKFGVTILEGLGLSETSPVVSFSRVGEPARVGSVGLPIPGVQMKLIDPDWNEITGPDTTTTRGATTSHEEVPKSDIGEIAVRGHNVMKGYYKRPEATAEVIRDGWFRTGDLARRDADGWYYVVDRAKEMVIRGGYNVYPREVEEVLMGHEGVSLCAVIGVPHESHGEEVKAVVIRQPGSTLAETDLIAWAKNQMADYKYPRIVEFVDALPMTATGKILKRELR